MEHDIEVRSLIQMSRSLLNSWCTPYERISAKHLLLGFAQTERRIYEEERRQPISKVDLERYKGLDNSSDTPNELFVPKFEFDAEKRLILTSIPDIFLSLEGGDLNGEK